MKKIAALSLLLCGSFFMMGSTSVAAQEVHQDLKEIVSAEITKVITEADREIEGTETSAFVQTLEARILSGTKEGLLVTFENELIPLEVGDDVYLHYIKNIHGDEYFIFTDFKRHTQLWVLGALFVALLLVFSGWHGFRALFSLALSIGAIVFGLVPLMLAGWNPILVSLLVSAVVLAVVLYFTHGFNSRSTIAFLGTFGAVLVTCAIAWVSVSTMRLTGFGSDASVSLNFATRGTLDFGGLLLGSIIIGILGMLDDVSITQVSVVRQLKRANKTFDGYQLYSRAIEVGKDHLGSLVNTLALAYVGVSLPLVLLFANADAPLLLTLNQEVVAAEFVRIIVGSIGLILAVPLTTLLAAVYFGKREVLDEHEESLHDHHHHAH
ncbi:MAG: hypothetical protein RLZZ76_647 [Candidatus Parcubacteria bacterium]|jgi:uncharacterized membrane protein